MSGSSESRASTPGLLYRSVHNSHETTVLVVELIGKEFNGVASCDEGVLAVCKDGLFTVSSNKLSCSITVEPEGNKTAVKNISTVDFISAAGGRGFFAGVSDSGCIYTWGDQGEHGQLGHGACVQSASEPSMISHGSRFTSIHCGEAFSVALDDSGGVYSWGENFDRQLGLYTKRKQGMHLSNAMIEDMSFVPRLLPLSLQLKITKIACGMRFVLAIEQGGNLFSWGAGECGQLGTGRCTRRELPELVSFDSGNDGNGVSRGVIDIACGSAHCLAVVHEDCDDRDSDGETRAGVIYSWGLNSCGQLGNGQSKALHYPQRIAEFRGSVHDDAGGIGNDALRISAVFGNLHSSAAIDSAGRLYTWGSTANYRLMHDLPLRAPERDKKLVEYAVLARKKLNMGALGAVTQEKAAEAAAEADAVAQSVLKPVTSLRFPTLVCSPHFDGSRISSFAFSKMSSAALIMTAIEKVHPVEGPRRAFSKLEIFGDGFWDTPSIIVKFSFKSHLTDGGVVPTDGKQDSSVALKLAAGMNPPRSCTGKFVSSKKIVCKPPKFAEVGIYEVSVSMNGVDFLPTTSSVIVHKDLSVTFQKPDLCDISGSRTPEAVALIPELFLGVRGLNPAKQVSCRDYFVRLQFVRLSGNGKFPLESRSSAALAAHLQQTLQNTLPIDMVVTGTLVNDRSIPPGMNAPPVDAAEEDFSIIRCENVDIQPLVEYCTSHNFVSLLEMRCAVSLNGQDYSTMPTAPAITAKPAVAAPAGDGAGPTKSSAETVPHASDSSTKAAFSGTLLYNFQPSTVKPCCASLVHLLSKLPASSAGIFSSSSGSSRRSSSENDRMEQLQRVTAAELTVLGSSFLPAARLPRGYVIEGRLQPQLHQAVVVSGGSAVIVDDAIDPKKDLLGIDVAVKCDTVNKLSVSISLAQLVVLQRIVEDLCCTVSSRHRGEESEADMESNSSVEVAHLPCKISFFLKTLPGGTEERLLHSAASEDPLVLNLYSGQQQCIVPSCTRHPHANPSRYAMILKGSGFRFFSSDMRVFLHLPRGGSGGAAAGSGDVSWHPPIQLPESAARMLPILRRREHSKPGQVAAAEDDDDDAAHTAVMQNEMESSKARGKSVDVISLPEQYWIEVNLQPLPTYLPQLLQEYQKIEGGRASDGGSAAISPDDACFSPSAVCLSVSLDGGVVEASEAWAKLFFHSSLAAYTFESPAPKGGFTAGASVALLLEEYCPAVDLTDVEPIISSESVEDGEEAIAVTEMGMDSDASKTPDDDQNRAHNAEHVRCGDAKNMPTPPRPHSCIVRIRGAPSAEMPEGAAVACTARLEEAVGDGGATADEMEDKATKTRFTFTIPPGVSATPGMLPGRTQGKEKFFFVDVSMDGGKKFDLCEAPLLALK